MQLPIDDIRGDFDRAISRSKRLVVTAETGAGKSTRVPVWLTEHADDGLVLVVEPRRVACHALADFLSSQRGESTGGFFGSRVRFSDRSSDRTRVLFCTPGVALRMLADPEPDVAGFVVDEFHERSWQMDLVVAAAASLEKFREVPLILTSATIDAEEAAGAIGAEMLHATGRTYPVDIRYDKSAVEPSDDNLGQRAARAVEKALSSAEGDVLVFLPGIKSIRATESALGRRSEEILIVHGSQPPEAMRRVFQDSDRRRIYLSTNVAETSITLPGVRIVIDSGLAKTRIHRAGRAALATIPISQASMEQRAGRAGRVAEGICIRLWSERHRPEPYRTPEIERVELDDMLLQAAELGLAVGQSKSVTWVTEPPKFAVERAQARLENLAAVKEDQLTERGSRLASLPVSAEEAALLVGAPPDIDATLCDLVAILQSRGSLTRSLDGMDGGRIAAIKEARSQLFKGVTDEVTMSLKLLREGDARQHHLSSRRLDEARAISRQLRDLVGASGESLEGLDRFILERLPEAGFVLRPRAQRKKSRSRSQPWANGEIEVNVYVFEPPDSRTDPIDATAAVILETEWLSSGTSVFGIGRMLLPTRPRTLADAGIGQTTIDNPQLSKKQGRVRIFADRQVELAGVVLDSREVELKGVDLRKVVADFTLQNRLFKKAHGPIVDALHGWRLLADWREAEDLAGYPVPEPPTTDDPREWLVERLELLGLETCDELALLENEDIIPQLADETGIPAWVYEPLVKEFPRQWSYQGATYCCTVKPASRRVLIEPDNRAARETSEPPAKVLPRFRGFRVDYAQDSRRIRLR